MTLQQIQYAVSIADTGSINSAAKELFISQSRLSGAVRELEQELDITIFLRTNRGIQVTAEGEEFLGYARQILDQYHLMEDKYLLTGKRRHKFSVSMQHYTFAVQAFIRTVQTYGAEKFEFAVHETQTSQVIQNVSTMKSELGVLYVNDFNRSVLTKLFHDCDVEFIPLYDCSISVYLSREHPLAEMPEIGIEQLKPYPCLSFEQGSANSFYFAEEVLSTYPFRQIIKVDDRATMLNMMIGLNGYTLCSGIICEELNGEYYRAIPLKTEEKMTIGYIKKKQVPLSAIAERYIEELKAYAGGNEHE
ncbi:MAG: LysR family transcriptional regulator [Oscillospiraceae bacterium]|nr:LysR family transcriptional regulator [Oscillospiraceae bacterium]